MKQIVIEKILEVSSEHQDHRAFSLITGFGDWTTANCGEEKADLFLKLPELTELVRLEIGNENSAWVDIQVSREGTDSTPLLPTLCLQSRKDSKDGVDSRARRILEQREHFNKDIAGQKFDQVKITCRQPFNRDVRYGLSYLKFFTNADETDEQDKKNKDRGNAEVELNIIGGKKEDFVNELAAASIKSAQFNDVNREKRTILSMDSESAQSPGDNTLRPKATPCRVSALISELRSTPKTPVSQKPSFLFAPRSSSAEQEQRSKKAAEVADKVIPGRSPKKRKLAPESPQVDKESSSSPLRAAFKISLKKTQESPSSVSRHPVRSKPPQKTTGNRRNAHGDISDSEEETEDTGGETEVRRRVIPPLCRLNKKEVPANVKRSVAVGARDKGIATFFPASDEKQAKKRKTSEVLDTIFSSDEDSESRRRDKENRKISDNPRSADQSEPHITLIDSDTENAVKAEVQSDGEDHPVVTKEEVIDLGESDIEVVGEVGRDRPKKKAKNRNPPTNCEVDSDDSDLEVVGNKLMHGVVFALSGFKNPYRTSLRGMAISMGAKYRPDWDDTCTHLICAFKNTPKFNEVKRKGGKIVSAAWIATSHLKQKLAHWKNYRLE